MTPKCANASLELTDAQIPPVTAMLKAMANESRLRILRSLLEGEQSVTQINWRLGLSQSALSQHLAVLRHENLVETRRSAQTIYYSLHGESARRVLAMLAELDL